MLRSEAISILKEGLAFLTGTGQDASIILRLQQAQRLLEQGRTLPRFLVQEDQTLSVTSGDDEISLPTGFIREADGESLHYTDSSTGDRYYLEKLEALQQAEQRFYETDPGRPRAYVLRNSTVAIYPERDTVYTLYWSYYKKADVLTSDVENAWLANAPDVLIGRAGMLMAQALRDKDGYAYFTELYTLAWKGILADDILRAEAATLPEMGSRR